MRRSPAARATARILAESPETPARVIAEAAHCCPGTASRPTWQAQAIDPTSRIKRPRRGYSFGVNGHDVPRTLLYLALLVSAYARLRLGRGGARAVLCGFDLFAVLRSLGLRFLPTRRLVLGRRLTAIGARAALIGIAARRWRDA